MEVLIHVMFERMSVPLTSLRSGARCLQSNQPFFPLPFVLKIHVFLSSCLVLMVSTVNTVGRCMSL
uniref:Uncharacterized protein n=1 Tax=Anguilla anguilla TaxID=7936 RepID=A0A0E9XTS7_ANGAN